MNFKANMTMKKMILSMVLAIMAGGSTPALAQAPVKKTTDKQTATKKATLAPKNQEEKKTAVNAKKTRSAEDEKLLMEQEARKRQAEAEAYHKKVEERARLDELNQKEEVIQE